LTTKQRRKRNANIKRIGRSRQKRNGGTYASRQQRHMVERIAEGLGKSGSRSQAASS